MPFSEAQKWLDRLGSCGPCYADFKRFGEAFERVEEAKMARRCSRHSVGGRSPRLGIAPQAKRTLRGSYGRARFEGSVRRAWW